MIITLAQTKGGVGKSTILVNLAVAIAQRGNKVGLIDTDTQRSVAGWHERRMFQQQEPAIECVFVQGDLRDTIAAMAKRNDYVLIDTAGFKSQSLGPAMVNSQLVLCPFTTKYYDLEVAPSLIAHESLQSAAMLNPKMKVRAVLNKCPTTHKDTRTDEALEMLINDGFKVLESRLYNREAYGDATQTGMGVTEEDNQKAKQEITALLEEIINGKA